MNKKIQKKTIKVLSFFFILFFLISLRYWHVKKIIHKPFFGTIFTKEIDVFSLEGGKIYKILITDDNYVKKNDLLIQLDTKFIDSKIKQIQTSIDYEKSKENLFRLKERKILEDYLNYKKNKKEESKEINNKLKILESIQILNNIQKRKISKLEAELSFYNERKNNNFICSPCSGQVQNLNAYVNQNIKANEKLLKISDSENTWLKVKIINKKAFNYKIGDNFNIYIEDFPDSKYQGKIFYISNEKSEKKDKYIDIKLSINQLKMRPNEITHLLTNGMKAYIKYE